MSPARQRRIAGALVLTGDVSWRSGGSKKGAQVIHLADADEDVVTLTVAAIRAHLERTDRDADIIGDIRVAGHIPRSAPATIAEALGRNDLPITLHPARDDAAADALFVALGSATGVGPSFVVAVSDGRESTAPHGSRNEPRPGIVALFEVDDSGPIRLVKEVHARSQDTARVGAGQLSASAIDALGGLTTRVACAMDAKAARRWLGARAPAALIGTASVSAGNMGHTGSLVALAASLATPADDGALTWLVPVEDGVLGARFEGEAPGDRFVVPETNEKGEQSRGGREVDDDGARRLAALDLDGQGATAQGAFVSWQQYAIDVAARYRLLGQGCGDCSMVIFPPRQSCPRCASDALSARPLSGWGSVYARTTIGNGGAPTEFVPYQDAVGNYAVAVVELDEGPKVAAMLTGIRDGDVPTGTRVRACLRLLFVQDGVRRYGFKFSLAPY